MARVAALPGLAALSADPTPTGLTLILGRPADLSIVVSVLAPEALTVHLDYGIKPAADTGRTKDAAAFPGGPLEIPLEGLQPDTRYYYRLNQRRRDNPAARAGGFHDHRPGWEMPVRQLFV